jgi:hypothetical protein
MVRTIGATLLCLSSFLVTFGQKSETETGLSKEVFSFDDKDSLTLFMVSAGCVRRETEKLMFIREEEVVHVEHVHENKSDQIDVSSVFFTDSILPKLHQFKHFHQDTCGSAADVNYVMYLNSKCVTIREKEWKLVDEDEQNIESCYVEDCMDATRLSTLYAYSETNRPFKKRHGTNRKL